MRVLVTGAGGFIGSAALRTLEAAGADVRPHAGPPGAPGPSAWARGDITDAARMAALAAGVDVVVHLAGPPSVAASFEAPAAFARAHVVGTATLLHAMRPGTRLVYVSSAEVYGCPDRNPVPEDAPRRPRSPYAAAKVGAEALVEAFADRIPAVVLRPFCVYGPGSGGVVGHVLRQVRAPGATAIELADARPVRDFCHVDDVAEAIVRAARADVRGAFNVGSGVGTAIGALAEAAGRALGRPLPVVERPERRRPVDLLALVADTSRIERALGWRPRIGLEEGLRRTIESWVRGSECGSC